MSEVALNLKHVRANIETAVEKSGRCADEVTLIAVSKTKPVSMLLEAYQEGCRDFGENKVQEILEKYDDMPHDARFHMIGHLQRNKVKYIIDKVVMIHSVDSLRLAEEISKEAMKKQVEMDILIEVNVAGEETIAPFVEDSEENREYFAKLRQLAVDIMHQNIDNVKVDVLSMGMTGDYQVAIEEGATYVRVGTGIFGGR